MAASSGVSEEYVKSLQRRVEALERKLLPQDDSPPVLALVPAVRELERKLALLGGKEKGGHVREVWGRMEEFETLLAPEYAQKLELTEDAKKELLVAQVAQLRQFVDRLHEINQLKDYINSTECQGVEGQEKGLARVAGVQAEQEEAVRVLWSEVRTLVEGYRQVMLQLSAQCVAWDEVLSHYEVVKSSS